MEKTEYKALFVTNFKWARLSKSRYFKTPKRTKKLWGDSRIITNNKLIRQRCKRLYH